MKLTYYGHSCFAVELQGKRLLFDPFITPNELAKAVDINAITADYILISHGHFDHINDAVSLAKRTGATVVSNFEIVEWLRKQGLSKLHPMNHGGGWNFDFGRVKYVNAVHSSSFPDGTYAGNPGGFVVTSPEANFYYSGDTALISDMELIGKSIELRFAVLCVGDNFTMGIDDAIEAARMLRCTEIVGVHYDTFPYIKIDHQAALQKFHDAHRRLHLITPNHTIDL
ncbi:MAG TPA: metal-dependent hydrolase [Verrucomicrobiae bacterium]